MSDDSEASPVYQVDKLISEARRLAADYRRATGKSLPGVSGEVADHDAARLLGLKLTPDAGGHDAVGLGLRDGLKIQIKARAIFSGSKSGQRIGQLKLDQDWDRVVLVLMDEDFEPFEIYEADREVILDAIDDSKSGSRNKRGVMSVARFKIIGHLAWIREEGLIEDEVWDKQRDS